MCGFASHLATASVPWLRSFTATPLACTLDEPRRQLLRAQLRVIFEKNTCPLASSQNIPLLFHHSSEQPAYTPYLVLIALARYSAALSCTQATRNSTNTFTRTATMGSLGTYFLDVVYSFTNCMVCFPSSPQLKINSRSFKILRLLGEVSFIA